MIRILVEFHCNDEIQYIRNDDDDNNRKFLILKFKTATNNQLTNSSNESVSSLTCFKWLRRFSFVEERIGWGYYSFVIPPPSFADSNEAFFCCFKRNLLSLLQTKYWNTIQGCQVWVVMGQLATKTQSKALFSVRVSVPQQ